VNLWRNDGEEINIITIIMNKIGPASSISTYCENLLIGNKSIPSPLIRRKKETFKEYFKVKVYICVKL